MDPKQVLGGFLTLTMFAMLGNMIKKDHFDSYYEERVGFSEVSTVHDAMKVTEQSLVSLPKFTKGPWKEEEVEELKSCFNRRQLSAVEAEEPQGFVVVSLSNGPEYHLSQIANAVVVAKYLGATLVLPDIRSSSPGVIRTFQEMYDIEKFIKSLEGVVKVAKPKTAESFTRGAAVVKVPHRVTEHHVVEHIKPILQEKGSIRLATYFPSINMRKTNEKKDVDSVACLAMYGTLELQPEVHEVIDSMLERLRTLSRKSFGQFIAVDLRVDMLQKKGCQANAGSEKRSCYNAQEVGIFLRNIGFDRDTTIYVTQSRWHSGLDALKKFFPNIYTKESILAEDKKGKFLDPTSTDFEKLLDFYICSQSDVFVPAISGVFYANVAGKRIASGRTQILVPGKVTSSSSIEDFVSPYVSKKNHLAYSCFC